MSELARKILLTSVGAIFMTEESIRKSLGDLKVPKDAMAGLLDSVRQQKNQILEIFASEFKNFLSKVKVHEEIQEALKGVEINLQAKIHFDEKSNKPSTKVTVKKTDR